MINFIYISIILFLIGLYGIFGVPQSIIIILISLELILLSINLNFIFFSIYLDDINGQIFALFVLTVAAAESAIGLAILVIYYRVRGIISLDYINFLKS
jgi:NADH-quinone oxidoreductase subunit K